MWIEPRNFERTESDDFKLNIAPLLDNLSEAVPIYKPNTSIVLGWKIQGRYE